MLLLNVHRIADYDQYFHARSSKYKLKEPRASGWLFGSHFSTQDSNEKKLATLI